MPDAARIIAIMAPLADQNRAFLIGRLLPAVGRAVRLAERDEAIRAIVRWLPLAGASARVRAAAVRRDMMRYGGGRWLLDRTRGVMPAEYARTAREPLYAAFSAGGGRPPLGLTQLRNILANTE